MIYNWCCVFLEERRARPQQRNKHVVEDTDKRPRDGDGWESWVEIVVKVSECGHWPRARMDVEVLRGTDVEVQTCTGQDLAVAGGWEGVGSGRAVTARAHENEQ